LNEKELRAVNEPENELYKNHQNENSFEIELEQQEKTNYE